jgi:hypothetical protein
MEQASEKWEDELRQKRTKRNVDGGEWESSNKVSLMADDLSFLSLLYLVIRKSMSGKW